MKKRKKKNHWTLTCIECPRGCTLKIRKVGKEYQVEGNQCKKGIQYAINEVTNPKRTLVTTVKTVYLDFPRLPVKTDKEIPLREVFLFMERINRVIVKKRLKPGDVIIRNMLKKDINLVATDNMTTIF